VTDSAVVTHLQPPRMTKCTLGKHCCWNMLYTRGVGGGWYNSSGHSVIVLVKMCTIQIFPSVLMMCLSS